MVPLLGPTICESSNVSEFLRACRFVKAESSHRGGDRKAPLTSLGAWPVALKAFFGSVRFAEPAG